MRGSVDHDRRGYTGPRSSVTAVVTLCVFLATVFGLGVQVHNNDTFGFGSGKKSERSDEGVHGIPCSFVQLQRGLTVRHPDSESGAATEPEIAGDMSSGEGLFFSKPGHALPFSESGNGFVCDAKYVSWLKSTALYVPDDCEMLTPGRDSFPFSQNQKVLMVGNSYMFQQVTALMSQYAERIDHEKSPSMMNYWQMLSGEKRCACVGDRDLLEGKKQTCIDLFSRKHWESPDGTSVVSFTEFHDVGDGFFAGMTGPPATMSVLRFKNGAELYMATNHPLMDSDVFGLESLAEALGIRLNALDAVYLNSGNQRGFGKMFCGGTIGDDVVKNGVSEMTEGDIAIALKNAGFEGKLFLTGKRADDDVSISFSSTIQRSIRGETPYDVFFVPFHMRMNKQFSPYVAGDKLPSCEDEPTCPRQTCEIANMEGCSAGEGHACAPGFPDVSVNMFLHALRVDVNQYYAQGW